ncbi:MAG TPA: DNA-directed RNA polymerase subunit omega [Thermoanaerobaculaceae bacterium]|nr:DNA-directed RNA polymerase subunit omega [Thermoanaerobaculaceae bacterium]HRS15166.1 DNA-directed RNA polymerase subunit omega [Thermoanaerobaculaceae bacterium]
MYRLPEGVESTFRFILIAAKRAEQLIGGARPRLATRGVKPTSVALEELMAGAVPWHPVTAEEYELIRQQETLEREREEQAPLFAAPLPVVAVAAEPEAEAEEEEFEEDLDALDFDDGLEVDDPNAEDLLAEAPLEE